VYSNNSKETTVSEGIQTNYFLELTHSLSLFLALPPLTLTLWTFHNRQPDTYFYTQQEYNSIQALSLSLSLTLSLLLVIYLAFIMPYIGVQPQAQQWHSLIERMIGAWCHGEEL
jgi:ABC-type sulfate transport system permease component